jgi:hypothetical protein
VSVVSHSYAMRALSGEGAESTLRDGQLLDCRPQVIRRKVRVPLDH